MKNTLLTICIAFLGLQLFAQGTVGPELILQAFPGLTEDQANRLQLSHTYALGKNRVLHFDLQIDGYRVEGATAVIGLHSTGKVIFARHRLHEKLSFKKENASFVTPDIIISRHAKHEGLDRSSAPPIVPDGRSYTAVSGKPYVHLEPVYIMTENAELFPVWVLTTDWTNSGLLEAFYYKNDGTLLKMEDRNYSCVGIEHRAGCNLPEATQSVNPDQSGPESSKFNKLKMRHLSQPRNSKLNTKHSTLNSTSPSYLVFDLPLENPLQGPRTQVVDPADPVASPFGWHDTDGMPGAEYETTRGNNAWVLPDRDGNFNADFQVTGGAELHFDPVYNELFEASGNLRAGVVNAFYTINRCHDLLHYYGFDEESGNFQRTNYSGTGEGGDEVEVYVQYGADDPYGYNPPAINNANFSAPPEGGNPVFRMYVWDAANRNLLSVQQPAEITGRYETGFAFFGPPVSEQPVSGELVLADDGVGIVSDACQPLINGDEIDGRIALIDRGDCRFGDKVLAAQLEGAVGAVVCNNRPGGITNMEDEVNGHLVDIPSVFISLNDCIAIKAKLDEGVMVELSQPDRVGPDTLDSALDNGLIIHEYMHGLSNRLTGGPDRTSCLNNYAYGDLDDGEQMGEGWSDFYALAFTDTDSRTGEEGRGYAGYLTGSEDPLGGIRPYPYSTDLTVNPVTYYDIYDASVPHGVGQVWASMLWDLYWQFREMYGFSDDPADQSAGNQRALTLVTQAMKIQPCDPGFVDGRDAILAADEMLFDGDHRCLIWSVFARRGLGFGAEQGANERRRDGKESYRLPPDCIQTAKIAKTMTPLIEAGDEIEVELYVRNDTEGELQEVVIEDEIPAGAEVVMSSLPGNATVESGKVVIPLSNMGAGQQSLIPYRLQSSSNLASAPMYEDDFDDGNAEARWETVSFQGNDPFYLAPDSGFQASTAWGIEDVPEVNMQYLVSSDAFLLDAELPVLRFYHRFVTEEGTDGGMVEVSTNGGGVWEDISDRLFREGYPNRISFNTVNEPERQAFSGDSEGWIRSYADLSPFAGNEILIRFRFASDFQFGARGWWVDKVEIFDAFRYQSQASLYSEAGLHDTALSARYGSIVEPDAAIPTEDPAVLENVRIFPNPGRNVLHLSNEGSKDYEIRVFNLQGRGMTEGTILGAGSSHSISTARWPEGMYLIEMIHDERSTGVKWVKW